MNLIIDRRLNGKNKSADNRRRFLKRFRGQIKKAVTKAVSGRSITDMENGEVINIPSKDISEPHFRHGQGGKREMVHPGNKEFVTGDKIPRPSGQGQGQGNEASNSGEGQDEFSFELSREEFLEFFFEDLALPDLIKTQLASITEYKSVRAGFSSDGVPTNLHVIRSLRGAMGRRIAASAAYKQEIRELEQQLAELEPITSKDDPRIIALKEEIEALRQRIKKIPYIDTVDLRYTNRVLRPEPTTKAVMFCLMDVSGSMDQAKKDMAKRFFILLYLFLTRTYEKIELVFIRHHTIAKEVDENDFFYSRETGGTVVSSALEMMHKIIQERYPTNQWNIYAAQASDGDNWNDDSPLCRDLLINSIMPLVQYYAYIEVTNESHKNLWREYLKVKAARENFAMQRIEGPADIYPVFRELFKKRTT